MRVTTPATSSTSPAPASTPKTTKRATVPKKHVAPPVVAAAPAVTTSAVPAPEPASPAQPKPTDLRTCDIVMKGGITSGVVYPQAITRLAERYRFVNIGGTSAGAIAAAIAAAAEYRRQKSIAADPNGAPDNGGFAKLDELPDILGQKPGRGARTKLFYFFQPNAGTRRLFDVLTTMLGGGAEAMKATLRRAMEEYATWTRFGMLPGIILAVTSVVWGTGWMAIVWAGVGAAIAAAGAIIAAVAAFALEFVRELPRNGYGLCTGVVEPPKSGEPHPPDGAEPLSAWLHTYLKETAGLAAAAGPLTFGQLWGTPQSDPEAEPKRVVNLEMMTTGITHGRPYRLPFRDDEDLHENYRFFFRPEEFRRYFPAAVVQWMLDHPWPLEELEKKSDREKFAAIRERCLRAGYHPLPAPADLPVVVATRMSLSFPVLLCAVPLHAFIHGGWDGAELPARCWFSDGGLTSNFPLHFFDTALPTRPTFSIDLIDKPVGTPAEKMLPDMDTKNMPPSDRWNQFDVNYRQGIPSTDKPDPERLLGFFNAIITTMQNWTDATQAGLPGYRDRIVRVPLTPNEGGLNLDMPEELIKALSHRGGQAADKLISHFCDPLPGEKMTWENHRWIRLRSLCGALEKTLRDIVRANASPEPGDRSYNQWLEDLKSGQDRSPDYIQPENEESGSDEEAPSYAFKGKKRKEQLVAVQEMLRALQDIPDLWVKDYPPSHSAPRPRPILRPRAQI